ncbi:hypothetical protein E3N88_30767 [Mikania micrantha]|uniref:Reverse transcriptase Ty1/copia-type domain-containing protein n=1 Tax=Mikania micrantha TaxID=192012 RepID=A0A5N6MN09_9ASTR|nr:hypothetical protein E3N88_30767 [Mikania micrantha]
MIITGNDKEEILKLKTNLFSEFEMKDLGRLKYFLGIEVLRSKQGIFICQKKYILDLLAETGMIDCKPAETPMVANQKLFMEEGAPLTDKEQYQRLVGKLIYLSHTRPDIAYVVGIVSQFMHQPQESHMEAVWRIIRYLKGTPGHGVLFKPNGHLRTQVYIDADWAGDRGDRRSTSGYFTLSLDLQSSSQRVCYYVGGLGVVASAPPPPPPPELEFRLPRAEFWSSNFNYHDSCYVVSVNLEVGY